MALQAGDEETTEDFLDRHRPANPVAGARRCCTSDRQKITPQSSGAGCFDGVCRHVPFFSSARIDDKGSFTRAERTPMNCARYCSSTRQRVLGPISAWVNQSGLHAHHLTFQAAFCCWSTLGCCRMQICLLNFQQPRKNRIISAWALTHLRASIPSA